MNQKIIISQHLETAITQAIEAGKHDYLFVLTDYNTAKLCWKNIQHYKVLQQATLITIPPTEQYKTLTSVEHVWKTLQQAHATRHSCLINLGGGMITDLGGFAASTFKRGINFINIPTTLLAMVDASVGGKTGINLNGLKNEIGVFNNAAFAILHAPFLKTLDIENIRSGYAEMLKHALFNTPKMLAQSLNFDLTAQHTISYAQLQQMIAESVAVKQKIVATDPYEQNIRKALNFGHTFGHAFEEWALKHKSILHGYAVAYGLICELYLSCIKCHFPTHIMQQTVQFIKQYYGTLPITCKHYNELIQLMQHDKKNVANTINFTLLSNIGKIHINQTATAQEIKQALDFLREGA